jgi:hypothetical protein
MQFFHIGLDVLVLSNVTGVSRFVQGQFAKNNLYIVHFIPI